VNFNLYIYNGETEQSFFLFHLKKKRKDFYIHIFKESFRLSLLLFLLFRFFKIKKLNSQVN
jgi:hypothetical protein